MLSSSQGSAQFERTDKERWNSALAQFHGGFRRRARHEFKQLLADATPGSVHFAFCLLYISRCYDSSSSKKLTFMKLALQCISKLGGKTSVVDLVLLLEEATLAYVAVGRLHKASFTAFRAQQLARRTEDARLIAKARLLDADISLAAGLCGASLEICEEVVSHIDETQRFSALLSKIYQVQGDYENAIDYKRIEMDHARRFYGSSPQYAAVLASGGYLLHESGGCTEEALNLFEAAVRLYEEFNCKQEVIEISSFIDDHMHPRARDEDDSKLCCICMDAPNAVGLLHGDSMHAGFCEACADKLRCCPICQRGIERQIRIFL
jgi:tetratricopeptide (TPR) repeat protein